MNRHDLKARLRRNLSDENLRGARQRARAKFSPTLSYGRHFAPAQATARQAAVLILLEPRHARWTIPLTVRPQHLADHPGQISFPGGRLEINETHEQAARREFAEELGVPLPGEIIGELAPLFIYNSNYAVRPFVAVADSASDYVPCPDEVAAVIDLPLATLENDKLHRPHHCTRGGVAWNAPAYVYDDRVVWGATAIMLAELGVLTAEA